MYTKPYDFTEGLTDHKRARGLLDAALWYAPLERNIWSFVSSLADVVEAHGGLQAIASAIDVPTTSVSRALDWQRARAGQTDGDDMRTLIVLLAHFGFRFGVVDFTDEEKRCAASGVGEQTAAGIDVED